MDSDYSSVTDRLFRLGFNNAELSDHLLRIEIVTESTEAGPDGEGSSIKAMNQDRRREIESAEAGPDGEGSSCKAMNQERRIEIATNKDENQTMECSTVLRVVTLHISLNLFAAKSPFFYKLFSNGMRETEQRHVTLRINASEEGALIELLGFMYSNSLTVTTVPALLDVMMAADKFAVASCMSYCSSLLMNQPMTPSSALLCLNLPPCVLMADAVQPLANAAKQFLAARYKDITNFQEEVMNFPLVGVEAILSSEDLQVPSEDALYDFVLKWVRFQYPKLEDRRRIIGSHICRLIRFPCMTYDKLRRVLTCDDFDHDQAISVVNEALLFKSERPQKQRTLAATNSYFMERLYKYRPVKVVEFELPCQQCVVYWDLKRDECCNLIPPARTYSQAFNLGEQGFFLYAEVIMDQQNYFGCFGLFLGMQEKGLATCAVDYEFAARSKPTLEYITKQKGNHTFTGGQAVGFQNLFNMSWSNFLGYDGRPYFINDMLHLRVQLTIRP